MTKSKSILFFQHRLPVADSRISIPKPIHSPQRGYVPHSPLSGPDFHLNSINGIIHVNHLKSFGGGGEIEDKQKESKPFISLARFKRQVSLSSCDLP